MTKAMKAKIEEWVNKQSVYPTLIVAHYIDKGDKMWSSISEEELEEAIQKEYTAEKERDKKGIVYMITASFTEALSRGAYSLAHLDRDLKCAIIKQYI